MRIKFVKEVTGDKDGIKIYEGKLNLKSIILEVMVHFIGGSMGSVVGEVVSTFNQTRR